MKRLYFLDLIDQYKNPQKKVIGEIVSEKDRAEDLVNSWFEAPAEEESSSIYVSSEEENESENELKVECSPFS